MQTQMKPEVEETLLIFYNKTENAAELVNYEKKLCKTKPKNRQN